MENIEIKKAQEFKYLGSTMDRDGDIYMEIKGKVYRTCVRLAIMYSLETIPFTKAAESKMEVAEMRMLRYTLGLTRLNRVPNAEVKKQLQTRRFGDKLREIRRYLQGLLSLCLIRRRHRMCQYGRSLALYMGHRKSRRLKEIRGRNAREKSLIAKASLRH
ncbi:uncharacterized protein LOC134766155 [Penaeus indicus]|uniref:uncharacterized protein LOC134766155 n=1 Tax=Penaeus indicus TaxID=29960 RepID=UPI00300D30F0